MCLNGQGACVQIGGTSHALLQTACIQPSVHVQAHPA
jgi:hypothetical protein